MNSEYRETTRMIDDLQRLAGLIDADCNFALECYGMGRYHDAAKRCDEIAVSLRRLANKADTLQVAIYTQATRHND